MLAAFSETLSLKYVQQYTGSVFLRRIVKRSQSFALNLTECFEFEFSFTELFAIKKFYFVVIFEEGAKALEFLLGVCAQIFVE